MMKANFEVKKELYGGEIITVSVCSKPDDINSIVGGAREVTIDVDGEQIHLSPGVASHLHQTLAVLLAYEMGQAFGADPNEIVSGHISTRPGE